MSKLPEEQAKTSQMTILNDSMAWQMRTWAKWQTQTGKSKAYLYYFTRQPPLDAPIKGAAHDAELYYVFHNLNLYPQQWAAWDRLEFESMLSADARSCNLNFSLATARLVGWKGFRASPQVLHSHPCGIESNGRGRA